MRYAHHGRPHEAIADAIAPAQLADDLGAAPAPGSLAAALAHGTGDPDLAVVYPLEGGERYVDAAGLDDAARAKVFEANARRVYPRLAVAP